MGKKRGGKLGHRSIFRFKRKFSLLFLLVVITKILKDKKLVNSFFFSSSSIVIFKRIPIFLLNYFNYYSIVFVLFFFFSNKKIQSFSFNLNIKNRKYKILESKEIRWSDRKRFSLLWYDMEEAVRVLIEKGYLNRM